MLIKDSHAYYMQFKRRIRKMDGTFRLPRYLPPLSFLTSAIERVLHAGNRWCTRYTVLKEMPPSAAGISPPAGVFKANFCLIFLPFYLRAV